MKLQESVKIGELLTLIGLENLSIICEDLDMARLTPTALYDAIPEVPVDGARFEVVNAEKEVIIVRFGRGELFSQQGERTAEFYLISVTHKDEAAACPPGLSALLGGAGIDPDAGTITTNLGVFITKHVRKAAQAYDEIMDILHKQESIKLDHEFGKLKPRPEEPQEEVSETAEA